MQYDIRHRPEFSAGLITFDQPGEQMVVEASAMVAKDSGLEMKTNLQGGLGGALKRKMLGGESLFQNTFTASAPGQTLWVAPGPDGDMDVINMDGSEPVMLASGAFIASAPSVTLDTKWDGAKGFFSGAGLFLLKATGTGPLFFGCFGAIHAVEVGPEGYIVDNNHIVGFTGGLDYTVKGLGGLVSFFGGGEGLVCEFRGQGTVWISTRNAGGLARFLHPFRPKKSN